MKNSNGTTILLAALIGVVVAVLAFFTLISPALAATQEAKDDLRRQDRANETLREEIAELKEQFSHLDEYLAEIAAIEVDIPAYEDAAGARRTFSEIFDRYGVVIMSDEIGTSEVVEKVQTLQAAALAVGQESYIEELLFQNLVATPFKITAIMSYEKALAISAELQLGEHRYYLLETVEMSILEPAPADGATPEILLGDVNVVFSGYFFTQVDPLRDPTLLPGPPFDPDAPEVDPFEPDTRPRSYLHE